MSTLIWALEYLVSKGTFKYLFDVPHVPNVDGVVVVDDGHLKVLLVVSDGGGVGVLGVRRVRRHVVDGQSL